MHRPGRQLRSAFVFTLPIDRPRVNAHHMTHLDVDFFVQLESNVWAALASGDVAADEQLLAEDFLGVYSSGFAGRAEHVGQLTSGPTVRSYALSQARICVLAEDLVILSYLATWSPQGSASHTMPERTFISSIWKAQDGVWQNIFSQDTKAEGAA